MLVDFLFSAEAQRSKLQNLFRVISCISWFQIPHIPLRVSVLRKITLRVLRVSPKAIAAAFKSLHLLLSPNTEYRGQWRAMLIVSLIAFAQHGGQSSIIQAIITITSHPSPCFAEGYSASV